MDTINVTPLAKPAIRSWVARHPLVTFFALAFAFAWIAALPSLIFGVPFGPYQTLGAFSPFMAAVIVAAASEGREGLHGLLRRMTRWRFGVGAYLLAIFSLVFLYLLALVLSGALSIQSLAGRWSLIFTFYLPALFTTYLLNPIGEETGWTGFALPRLQKRFSPWLAAVVLGILWAAWHLPAYFIPSEMGAFNAFGFFIFVLLAVFTRVMWTWVTNMARGSGVAAVLLHASSNAVSIGLIALLVPATTANQSDDFSGPILLGLLLLSSILIIAFTRGHLSYGSDS